MTLPPLPKGMGAMGGAFDLSSLRKPPLTINPEHLGYVVTQANLVSELLPASNEAIVIILCWSARSAQAQSLIPMIYQFNLDDYTTDGVPTWIFATVDVDAEPAVAKAMQVKSIPLAIAIIQEQLVPLFESIPAAEQVRAVIDKVIELGAQKGVGTLVDTSATTDNSSAVMTQQGSEPALEPEEELAMAAIERGDLAAAKSAYELWVKRSPGSALANLGLIQIELMLRIEGLDPTEVLAKADAIPEDLMLQIRAADCEIAQGNFDGAADRLIAAVKFNQGDDRKRARDHLLLIFSMVDADDPRLPKVRQRLASALF